MRDPALVAPTLAQALDVRESPGATPVQSLAAYLGPRRLLLVLDSFEAVASAGPLLAQLIGVAPGLQLLVTSRSLLRVRGEHEYVVSPLRVPAAGAEADDDALLAYGAVRLFMERAQAARPDLPAEGEALRAAVEICRRLDGVPLALELAAARVRVLTVEALLARLEHGLDALGGGVIDLPERQRTLRATLDWDHDLLSLEEQVLLRRLAVFVRSFTVEAAEDVARVHGLGPDDDDRMQPDIVDGIDALLGKSLLRQLEPGPGGEVRFGMLQTIREYAMQRLLDSGEAAEARARHLDYCLRLAERGRAAVGGPQQGAWLQRLEDAHDELRAGLHHADDLVDVGRLVRLCAALGAFWRVHGHFTEGRRWLDRALALSVGWRTGERAELLNSAAFIARARGAFDLAEDWYLEALSIRQEVGDVAGQAASMRYLGNVAFERGDLQGARTQWLHSLDFLTGAQDMNNRRGVLNNLGVAATLLGRLDEAQEHLTRALGLAQHLGDAENIARGHENLGLVAILRGEGERGSALAREGVHGFASLGNTWDLVDAVEILARGVGAEGRAGDSGWLYGAAEGLREAIGAPRAASEEGQYQQARASERARDPQAFDAGVRAGRTASLEDMVARALDGRREQVRV